MRATATMTTTIATWGGEEGERPKNGGGGRWRKAKRVRVRGEIIGGREGVGCLFVFFGGGGGGGRLAC